MSYWQSYLRNFGGSADCTPLRFRFNGVPNLDYADMTNFGTLESAEAGAVTAGLPGVSRSTLANFMTTIFDEEF